jgi:hypothetical protein
MPNRILPVSSLVRRRHSSAPLAVKQKNDGGEPPISVRIGTATGEPVPATPAPVVTGSETSLPSSWTQYGSDCGIYRTVSEALGIVSTALYLIADEKNGLYAASVVIGCIAVLSIFGVRVHEFETEVAEQTSIYQKILNLDERARKKKIDLYYGKVLKLRKAHNSLKGEMLHIITASFFVTLTIAAYWQQSIPERLCKGYKFCHCHHRYCYDSIINKSFLSRICS